MKKRYRKRVDQIVTAVQLDFETTGFQYEKWGDTQKCHAGDWIVENNGECYTISADSFTNTYELVSAGRYKKVATVMAEQMTKSGKVETREGSTMYSAGDYLVHNREDGTDTYAVDQKKFEEMYQED